VPLREDVIHYHVREELTLLGWKLLAGQYPNGSDDDLPCLSIVDPTLARDRSPDSRRHSLHKLVPDLIAVKDGVLLVIEMKPTYDALDEAKLMTLMTERRGEFNDAFDRLSEKQLWGLTASQLEFAPCLAFTEASGFPSRRDFSYALINESLEMHLVPGNQLKGMHRHSD
jgi:hypothetical protein